MDTVDDHLEQLVDYVEDQLAKGVTEDVIRAVLLQNGHDAHLIDDIFAFIHDPDSFPQHEAWTTSPITQYKDASPVFPIRQDHDSSLEFRGRLGRREYAIGFLISFAMTIVVVLLGWIMFLQVIQGNSSEALPYFIGGGLVLLGTIGIVSNLINLSITARRMHDMNLSANWLYWGPVGGIAVTPLTRNVDTQNIVILIVSVIIVFVVFELILLFRKGTDGSNKYGEPTANSSIASIIGYHGFRPTRSGELDK